MAESMEGNTNLFEVIKALGPFGSCVRFTQCRKEQSSQKGNNASDQEEFHQGKAVCPRRCDCRLFALWRHLRNGKTYCGCLTDHLLLQTTIVDFLHTSVNQTNISGMNVEVLSPAQGRAWRDHHHASVQGSGSMNIPVRK